MLEKYRVMGAALALGEFTIKHLSEETGVAARSVKPILRHLGEYVEPAGDEAPQGRGRPAKRWRVRDDKVDEIGALLATLRRDVDKVPVESARRIHRSASTPSRESDVLPAALYSARALLLRDFPAIQEPTEQRHLLEMAEVSCQSGIETLGLGGLSTAETESLPMVRTLRFLIALGHAEILHAAMSIEAPDEAARAAEPTALALAGARHALRQLQAVEFPLLADVARRVEASNVRKALVRAETVVDVISVGDPEPVSRLTDFAERAVALSAFNLRLEHVIARHLDSASFPFSHPVLLELGNPANDRDVATELILRISALAAPLVVFSAESDDYLENLTLTHRGRFLRLRGLEHHAFGTTLDSVSETTEMLQVARVTAAAVALAAVEA